MTTNDIDKIQILLCCKNGDKLLGVTDDQILLNFIAQYVKFVQIDENKTGIIPLSEIIKNKQEANEKDYTNIKQEDEPVEVFINYEVNPVK